MPRYLFLLFPFVATPLVTTASTTLPPTRCREEQVQKAKVGITTPTPLDRWQDTQTLLLYYKDEYRVPRDGQEKKQLQPWEAYAHALLAIAKGGGKDDVQRYEQMVAAIREDIQEKNEQQATDYRYRGKRVPLVDAQQAWYRLAYIHEKTFDVLLARWGLEVLDTALGRYVNMQQHVPFAANHTRFHHLLAFIQGSQAAAFATCFPSYAAHHPAPWDKGEHLRLLDRCCQMTPADEPYAQPEESIDNYLTKRLAIIIEDHLPYDDGVEFDEKTMHAAARSGNLVLVKYLQNQGVNVNDNNIHTCLSHC